MASKSTSFYLSEGALSKLDQVVISMRKTGLDSNRSVAVEHLIEYAHAQIKRIEPIRNGKKVIGWQAFYGDHLVATTDGAYSKTEAQTALDAYVYEELSK